MLSAKLVCSACYINRPIHLKLENKNIAEENFSHICKLENINETRNYFIKEINQNELMSRKHEKRLYGRKLY